MAIRPATQELGKKEFSFTERSKKSMGKWFERVE